MIIYILAVSMIIKIHQKVKLKINQIPIIKKTFLICKKK